MLGTVHIKRKGYASLLPTPTTPKLWGDSRSLVSRPRPRLGKGAFFFTSDITPQRI